MMGQRLGKKGPKRFSITDVISPPGCIHLTTSQGFTGLECDNLILKNEWKSKNKQKRRVAGRQFLKGRYLFFNQQHKMDQRSKIWFSKLNYDEGGISHLYTKKCLLITTIQY